MRQVYYNSRIVPESEAKVSVYDSALMFGDMVFEMTRSFNGKQFKLKEHLERLYGGLRYFHINPHIDMDQLEQVCMLVQDVNSKEPEFKEDDEHRLMVNISRGPLSIYRNVEEIENRPTVIVTDFPLRWTVAGFGEYYRRGVRMATVTQLAIPHRYLDPKVKCRSRAHLMMANLQAAKMIGNPWALLLDEHGCVAEGTGDNFFIVKDRKIITTEDQGILRGISRGTIINSWSVECKNISMYDVINADEVFITGTPFCILPVTAVNEVMIGDGKPGEVTGELLSWWSEMVGVNIPEQIQRWDDQGLDVAPGVSPYQFSEE